jgi:hypothetical protein
LRADLTYIGDGNGVGKYIQALLRRRLLGQIAGGYFYPELVLGHGAMLQVKENSAKYPCQ